VRRFSGILLLLLVAAAVLAAQEMVLVFTPAQTAVEFTLAAALHTVHGTFQLKRGRIRFDPATGQASGELVVDSASGESGSGARDSRMKKNVLESARYPDITFRPDRVEGVVAMQGSSQVRVHGMFAIHGSEHEITIPVELNMGPERATATLKFQAPYVKWGMKDPSNFILKVKDTVDINVTTTAEITASPRT